MELATELLRSHSASHTQRLVRHIGADAGRLAELVALVSGPPGRLSQLAADVLGWCAARHPARLVPHLPRLLPLLAVTGHHPAVRRGVARGLQVVPVPADLQAEVFDRSLALLGSGPEPAAVKAYLLTVLTKLAGQHPALANEVLALAERQLPQAPPSFRARAARLLPGLRQLARQADLADCYTTH